MRTVSFICLFCLCHLALIKSDDDNEQVKSNAPVIESSSSNIYFEEQFQDNDNWSRWIRSIAKKDGVEESLAKYDGEWAFELPQLSVYTDDYGLILKSKARHHAISTKLNKPFDFTTSPLIVQYEVKFQTNQECGGAYVKLLSNDGTKLNLQQVTDKTPYTIMFGPDMCGAEHKYHFIIRYRNPKTGLYTEHQAKKPTESLDSYFTDKKSHLYTLVLSSDNSFKMYIDNKLINSGNCLEDMEPAIVPPKEINDETDRKPENWDEEEKIVDSKARKPDDWDENAPREIIDHSATMPKDWLENEPMIIPDPEATKPEDWDNEIDGSWEAPSIDNPQCKIAAGCGKWTAPTIPNPAYRGKWLAPLINNPNYRGKWEPRKIPNPNYFDDAHPYQLTPIGALTLELWSMVDGVVFDNFLFTSDQSLAKQYADQLWSPKFTLEEKVNPSFSSSLATPTSTTATSFNTLIDTIKSATERQPWLWAVYAIIVLLPVIIVGLYCSSGESTTKKSVDGLKKKNDNYEQKDAKEKVSDDDEVEEQEVIRPATTKDELETENKPSSPSSKAKPRRALRKE